MTQTELICNGKEYDKLDLVFRCLHTKRLFLVCGNSIKDLKVNLYFATLEERLGIKVIRFNGFTPNPRYDSVIAGVKEYKRNKCDTIISVGGGSAMDVGKCIKMFTTMDPAENYLKQKIRNNEIPFLAIPTTAGTGSEATRFAVVYHEGEKQSVSDASCIPGYVVFDATVLDSLPIYQKRATMMDALCHAIESYWSINSTAESIKLSAVAIRMIFANMELYFENNKTGNENMLRASNIAGRAINITQTTSAHALGYKITSLYNCPHGHAVAICLPKIWNYMKGNLDKCIDARGATYVESVFTQIAGCMGCEDVSEAIKKFEAIMDKLELKVPLVHSRNDISILTKSVNQVRIKNNPVYLPVEVLKGLYQEIFNYYI